MNNIEDNPRVREKRIIDILTAASVDIDLTHRDNGEPVTVFSIADSLASKEPPILCRTTLAELAVLGIPRIMEDTNDPIH